MTAHAAIRSASRDRSGCPERLARSIAQRTTRRQPAPVHLAMVTACRLLLACTLVGALVACSSDSSSDASSGLTSARAADVSPRTSPSATASEQQGESDPLDDPEGPLSVRPRA